MSSSSTTSFGPARVALAGMLAALLLAGCGAGSIVVSTKTVSVPPVTSRVYSIDGTDNLVLEYELTNSMPSQTGTLSLPPGFSATLLATDTAGNLYVGGTTSSAQQTEVLVYAAGAAGTAAPQRTVSLTAGKLTALAVDSSGQIYAGKLNTLASIEIYAANASGMATPSAVLDPPDFRYLNDIAVSPAGAISASGWNGGAFFIQTYAPGANGAATPTAALFAPQGSYFGGIALDSHGNLWALEELTLVEYAPGATGTPTPVTLIDLPAPPSPYTGETYSDVLGIDANGLLYVPVTATGTGQGTSMVYVFAPTESGMATPAATVPLPTATQSTPLGTDVPMAVR